MTADVTRACCSAGGRERTVIFSDVRQTHGGAWGCPPRPGDAAAPRHRPRSRSHIGAPIRPGDGRRRARLAPCPVLSCPLRR